MYKNLIALAVIISFAFPLHAESLKPGFKIGKTYTKTLTRDGKPIAPLPVGKWEVVGADRVNWRAGNKRLQVDKVFLAQVENAQLKGVIEVTSPIKIMSWAKTDSDRFCDRKDIHFIINRANYRKETDCWGVNHIRFKPKGDDLPKHIKQGFDWAKKNKLSLPKNTIAVTYVRFLHGKVLDVTYQFNPEIEGIKKSKKGNWRKTDWHKNTIDQYPEKKAFVKKIIAWGKKWDAKVDSVFSK